jgi:hypothetical protein
MECIRDYMDLQSILGAYMEAFDLKTTEGEGHSKQLD